LVLGLCAVNVHPQTKKPYTKEAILGMLKGLVAPQRVAVLAQQRGIDFQITAGVEIELRRTGATDALLTTLVDLAPKLPPGTVTKDPKAGLKYVWIPPGSFMMGCSPGDSECEANERPFHQVTITNGFWLGQTPVTVAAYRRYSETTGKAMPPAPDDNSAWKNPEMPIVSVSWNDSVAYCAWAGGRLPTEAEWEYAARAGSTEARYGPLNEIAWYSDNSGDMPHEVARKRANAWNLYDMLGSVFEWVNDRYGENYYQASPQRDPQGPGSGQGRVFRGGPWDMFPKHVRVSVRYGYPPNLNNSSGLGYRCVGEVSSP
jgi:formylglycine-generating enzyme required for sulfatase activity